MNEARKPQVRSRISTRNRSWFARVHHSLHVGWGALGHYRSLFVERAHDRVARELARRRAPAVRVLLRLGIKRNFAVAQLRGLDLRGPDLRGVSFRGANLTEALLDGGALQADLSGAVLCDARIYGIDLSDLPVGIALQGAKFRDVRCSNRGRQIAVPLRGVDLRGADLRAANLRDADLRGVDLRNADLREAILEGADLGGRANLQGANLSRARLYGANLARADLTGADLRDADVRGANLSGADLQLADLTGADLRGTLRSDHSDGTLGP